MYKITDTITGEVYLLKDSIDNYDVEVRYKQQDDEYTSYNMLTNKLLIILDEENLPGILMSNISHEYIHGELHKISTEACDKFDEIRFIFSWIEEEDYEPECDKQLQCNTIDGVDCLGCDVLWKMINKLSKYNR